MGIAILLANLLPSVLQNIPGISVGIKQLIVSIGGSLSAIFSSGVIQQPTAFNVLAAWYGVVLALKKDPSIPANALNVLAELEKAIKAALTEDLVAAKAVDWTLINPIAPVA